MEQKLLLSIFTLMLIVVICQSNSIQHYNATAMEQQDERISNLEKSLQILETAMENLNKTVQKGVGKVEPVMFYAIIHKSGYFTLNTKSTLVFEKILLNIGEGYNNYDGVFVAPRKGVYLFSWTISIDTGDYAVTELVVENNVISSTGDTADSGTGYRSTSMTALCRMNREDHAFIRTTGFRSANLFYSYGNYPKTSFLGILLREE